VSWNDSGNVDNSIGSSSATNFSISPTDQNAFEGDLPNDIATSESESTEITGVTSDHQESFNVQAAGQRTIKEVAAQQPGVERHGLLPISSIISSFDMSCRSQNGTMSAESTGSGNACRASAAASSLPARRSALTTP
jgi:hypothetical protein